MHYTYLHLLGAAGAALTLACTTSSTTPSADAGSDTSPTVDAGPGGGPVTGPADGHCVGDAGPVKAPVSAASCFVDAAAVADAGAVDYGSTLPNAEGDDDDCKYHVKWTTTDIREATDVTFTVTVTAKADGAPVRPLAGEGAKDGFLSVRAEVFLDDTHPAPDTAQNATETQPGTYAVGPIRFDKAGRWTVRFHVHEICPDVLEDSPHGHAAFFVEVP